MNNRSVTLKLFVEQRTRVNFRGQFSHRAEYQLVALIVASVFSGFFFGSVFPGKDATIFSVVGIDSPRIDSAVSRQGSATPPIAPSGIAARDSPGNGQGARASIAQSGPTRGQARPGVENADGDSPLLEIEEEPALTGGDLPTERLPPNEENRNRLDGRNVQEQRGADSGELEGPFKLRFSTTAMAAGFLLTGLWLTLVRWGLSRGDTAREALFERRWMTNRLLLQYKDMRNLVEFAFGQPDGAFHEGGVTESKFLEDMFVFAELDNLEHAFEQYLAWSLADSLAERAGKIFMSRGEDPKFNERAHALLWTGKYNSDFVSVGKDLLVLGQLSALRREYPDGSDVSLGSSNALVQVFSASERDQDSVERVERMLTLAGHSDGFTQAVKGLLSERDRRTQPPSGDSTA